MYANFYSGDFRKGPHIFKSVLKCFLFFHKILEVSFYDICCIPSWSEWLIYNIIILVCPSPPHMTQIHSPDCHSVFCTLITTIVTQMFALVLSY